jgi:hypothetical protein
MAPEISARFMLALIEGYDKQSLSLSYICGEMMTIMKMIK